MDIARIYFEKNIDLLAQCAKFLPARIDTVVTATTWLSVQIRTASGAVGPRSMNVRYVPRCDAEGNVSGCFVLVLDVTEHRRAELALRESEQRLRAVIDTAVDGIITIDERGCIDSFNPAAVRIFGYQPEEIIGRNISALMPDPYRSEHDSYLAAFLATGVKKIIGVGREVAGRRKDGSTFPADLAISQFHDNVGLMFTGILRDVSERKQMQQYLSEVRTEKNRVLSHELHDGVGGLMVGIGLLAKTLHLKLKKAGFPEADQMAELLRHIGDADQQLRRVSRGLLPLEVNSRELDLALGELAERINQDGLVAVTFKSNEGLSIQSKDQANQLYRIAQEAVSNAVRHGQPKHITIGLESDDSLVTLWIEDDGIGIQGSSDGREGMGLRTMQYRASQIGAVLSLEPRKDGGTIVKCTCCKEAEA